MKSILVKLRGLFASRRTSLTAERALAERVRVLAAKCAVCGKGTGQHSFALVATAVPSRMSEDQVAAFIGLVKRKEWQALVTFQEWRGDEDDLEVFAVFCPLGGGTTVLTLDPVELFERNQILTEESFSAKDGERILSVLPSAAPTGTL